MTATVAALASRARTLRVMGNRIEHSSSLFSPQRLCDPSWHSNVASPSLLIPIARSVVSRISQAPRERDAPRTSLPLAVLHARAARSTRQRIAHASAR